LTLYSTLTSPAIVWQKKLANHAKFAELSYDSGYVASIGAYDRLVKIWRRLSFGSEDVRFDFTYLSHPRAVTSLRWRRPHHVNQTIDNVLYTICSDNVLRIWASTDPHGLQILQLWTQIDLQESIQSRSPSLSHISTFRYAFIIDSRDFIKATEYAVQKGTDGGFPDGHALEHLIEVANRSPEVCVVLDEYGRMSAWGLENVGCKARKTTNIFNITHVSGLEFKLPDTPVSNDSFVRFYTFCNPSGGHLQILVHHFDGRLELFESNVAQLFDISQRHGRIRSKAVWTGHSRPIKKIVRNISGRAVVSRTDDNESIVWMHVEGKHGTTLTRQSTIITDQLVHRICVLRKGSFVVYLHHSNITLWDCRSSRGQLLASCSYQLVGKPLCVLVLPKMDRQASIAHIATISSKMKGIVWQIRLPRNHEIDHVDPQKHIEEFCTFDLGDAEELAYVLPVDPAGSPPVISGFLDTFARDVAISYTDSGVLRSWAAKVDIEKHRVDWLLTCSVETGICKPALASGSSIRKAAVVNSSRSELTIWDVRGAQLEFSQDYETQDNIQDLDWTSTPDDQSILAVGFRYSVLLLSQMRYDYLNKGPAWAPIREFSIRDFTPHPIGDSTWLGGGNLVVGAGNQLFIYDKTVEISTSLVTNLRLPQRKDPAWELFDVVSRLNGPLPIYHPQLLSQCILSGKITLVQRILLALYKSLKFYVNGDVIDNFLGISLEDFYANTEVT
jgi:WD40 repeat protein